VLVRISGKSIPPARSRKSSFRIAIRNSKDSPSRAKTSPLAVSVAITSTSSRCPMAASEPSLPMFPAKACQPL
jgi:hypothetical protein